MLLQKLEFFSFQEKLSFHKLVLQSPQKEAFSGFVSVCECATVLKPGTHRSCFSLTNDLIFCSFFQNLVLMFSV